MAGRRHGLARCAGVRLMSARWPQLVASDTSRFFPLPFIVPTSSAKGRIVMRRGPATIAPEVIDCIADGRSPTVEELYRVADHIWSDVRGSRSAFTWGELTHDNSERLLSIRAAQAALVGDQ
jgi:hypothetical protein